MREESLPVQQSAAPQVRCWCAPAQCRLQTACVPRTSWNVTSNTGPCHAAPPGLATAQCELALAPAAASSAAPGLVCCGAQDRACYYGQPATSLAALTVAPQSSRR